MKYASISLLLVTFLTHMTSATEFTLPGRCPSVKLQKNFDYTKFSGLWYTVATFASDGRSTPDCSSMDFQEDNLGFTLRETYVMADDEAGVAAGQQNKSQKGYLARVDPTFDAGNEAKFIVSYDINDKVLQFPFYILSTDYDHFAIAYTCKSVKKAARTHYAFAWVLSRRRATLEGDTLGKVEAAVASYAELSQHRPQFVFKDFTEQSCNFQIKFETDFFTNNFW